MQKTSHDLQLSLTAFQRAQKASVERQRTVVEGVKIAVDDDAQALCVSSRCLAWSQLLNLRFLGRKWSLAAHPSNGKRS